MGVLLALLSLVIGKAWAEVVVTDFGGEAGYLIYDTGDGRHWVVGPYYSAVPAPLPEALEVRPGATGQPMRVRGVSVSGAVGFWRALPHAIQPEADEARPIQDATPIGNARPLKGQRFDMQFVGLRLPRLTPLNRIAIAFDGASAPLPGGFAVQTSIDGGETWHGWPRAALPHVPDPRGSRYVIPLHGVTADAVRVVTHRPPPEGLRLNAVEMFADQLPPLVSLSGAPGVAAQLNNLWLAFGTAATEAHLAADPWRPNPPPFENGMLGLASAEWSDWNARKLAWSADPQHRRRLADALAVQRIDDDGYVWASPHDEKHLDHSRHYTTNAAYAAGVARTYLWTRDDAWLGRRGSDGRTVLERARAALGLLMDLGARDGLVTLRDPAINGTASGLPGNYWDAWRFGGADTLLNIWTCEALRLWAELEQALGGDAAAAPYRAAAAAMEARLHEVLWNPEARRLVGALDVHGNAHDYGFTFVNLAGLAAGLLPPEKARDVLDWLDGRRVAAGDTSVGDDIYAFGFAPRSNTLAAEARGGEWWESWGGRLAVSDDGPGIYGRNVQNGGTIFYVSADDLMGRLRTRGVDDAAQRLHGILAEHAKDGLRRQPVTPRYGHNTIVGIQGPFPESGLVPLFALEGFAGLRPTAKGLVIHPRFPAAWDQLTLHGLCYAGRDFTLLAAEGLAPTVEETDGRTVVRVPRGGRFLLTSDGRLEPVKEERP